MHLLEKIAKRHFGVTDNLEETGYVLSDGTFLDLSGRHHAIGYERRGDRFVPKKYQPDYLYGQRNTDHRELPPEIFKAVGTGEGSDAMFIFLRETGALRLMPGAGFLVARMPTVESVSQVVREWHHAFGDEPLYVDVVSPGSRPGRASRVINPDDVRESQEFERPSLEEVMAFLDHSFRPQSGLAGHTPKKKITSEQAEKLIADDDTLFSAVALYTAQNPDIFMEWPEEREKFIEILRRIRPFKTWFGTFYRGQRGDCEEKGPMGFRSWSANRFTAEAFARDYPDGIVCYTSRPVRAVSITGIATWRMRLRDESHYPGMQAEYLILDE